MPKIGLDDFLLTHTREDLDALPSLTIEDLEAEMEPMYQEWLAKHALIDSTPAIGGAVHMTDAGNAERLHLREAGNIKWSKDIGWRIWDGERWEADGEQKITTKAIQAVRQIYAEAAQCSDDDRRSLLAKWAVKSEAAPRINAMIDLCRSIEAVKPDVWDNNIQLLNLQNGTLNLETGEFYEHRKEDLITRICNVNYDPDAECPLWRAQLDKFVPSIEDQQFLQRAAGYSLSGNTTNHCFFILFGEGGNGKSTFIETVFDLMGDYAGKLMVDTIIDQNYNNTAADIAALHGIRLALASEPNAGKRLNTSIIKQMTGELMRGRHLYGKGFDFQTTHKLWLETNHKLSIPDDDDGTWRRLKQLPWTVQIQDSDMILGFKDRLKEEYPGILNWLIDGYKKWTLLGNIGESPNSKQEKETYRKEQDSLNDFLDANYEITGDPDDRISKTEMSKTYVQWVKETGGKPMSTKAFAARMRKRKVNGVIQVGEQDSNGHYWTKLTTKNTRGLF
jgi:putative DNA primase/helicase